MRGGAYRVLWTATAWRLFEKIRDARVRRKIHERTGNLDHEPALQGKPMKGDLVGHRSVRAVGQRYRILYAVREREKTVHIKAVGIRKDGDKRDIYTLAEKLVRLGYL